jgi:hypothetical protein
MLFDRRRNCLRNGRSRSLYQFIRRMIKRIVVIIKACKFFQLHNKILPYILHSRLTPYSEEIIGKHQYGFRRNISTTDHTFCVHQILEKKWEFNKVVYQLFIDFKKAYYSVRRKVLLNTLTEFGIQRNW